MKITYEFVDGTKVEITVDEKTGKEIEEMEYREFNKNRAETRRHISIDCFNDKSKEFSDEKPESFVKVQDDYFEMGDERIIRALNKLTSKQRDAIEYIYMRNFSMTEYAKLKGMKKSSVSDLHKRAIERLRKFL